MAKVIGIDLGTTNCCIAAVGPHGPMIIEDEPDRQGIARRVFPSFMAVGPTGETFVGHTARQEAFRMPSAVVYGTKRLMGRSFTSVEVQTMLQTVSYQIAAGPEQQAVVQVGGQTFTPEDVAAALLSYLRRRAELVLDDEVNQAVITVPAHFNDRQRRATREAGERAGLEVLALINEPTAAAIAFGWATKATSTIAVYDLGGGTFDITILKVGDGVYDVLSTAGDTFLGGSDFDHRLVVHVMKEHVTRSAIKPLDPISTLRLKTAAERAKIELSAQTEAELVLNAFLGIDQLRVKVTRADFERMTRDLVVMTTEICGVALEAAGLKPFEVNGVVLVGGQTRMPFIRQTVQSYFQKEPIVGMNPDEAVAAGAALHAQALVTPEEPEVQLLDVTPLTLGIATARNSFSAVIPKNHKVPCTFTRTFSTVRDKQTSVKIVVLQGESSRASQNTFLGQFVLEGIEPAPRLEPKVDVTFRLDDDGILHVSALDRSGGGMREIDVNITRAPVDVSESTDVALKDVPVAAPEG